MKIRGYFIMLSCLLHITLCAETRIDLYLYDYPLSQERADELMHKMNRPEKIAKYELEGMLESKPSVGIFSTYAGFLNASDMNGHITFPKKHTNPLLYLIITPEIEPVMMFNATVHHWKLKDGYDAALFSIKKEFDAQTETHFWQVAPAPQPENNIIPLEAMVIFAKPKHVVVPEGITIIQDKENWILPNVYIQKGVHALDNALYILSITNLLRPIDIVYKKEKTRMQDSLVG